MNEVEANKKAQDMIAQRIHVYCPISNAMCRLTCECYKMPEVWNVSNMNDSNSYKVRHGFCTSYALKGACD